MNLKVFREKVLPIDDNPLYRILHFSLKNCFIVTSKKHRTEDRHVQREPNNS